MSLLRIRPLSHEETFTFESEPVLLCKSTLPDLSRLDEKAQKRINRCYQTAQRQFYRRMKQLQRKAAEALALARAAAKPFEPWEAALEYTAEERENTLSIDLTYTLRRPGEPEMQRNVNTLWDLSTGFPVEKAQCTVHHAQ